MAHVMGVSGNRMIVSERVIVISDRVGVRHVMMVVINRMGVRDTVRMREPARAIGWHGAGIYGHAKGQRSTYE